MSTAGSGAGFTGAGSAASAVLNANRRAIRRNVFMRFPLEAPLANGSHIAVGGRLTTANRVYGKPGRTRFPGEKLRQESWRRVKPRHTTASLLPSGSRT